VDVRVVAATHQELDRQVADGKFRSDLFYRLQGVRLRLPSLRERIEDLPHLVNHFLRQAQQRLSRPAATVTTEALRLLWGYPWPGNIRELQHVLEGALLLSDGVIMPEHLPPAIQHPAGNGESRSGTVERMGSLDAALEESERQLILDALRKTNGVQARAAKLLGITEQSLWYRVKKYKIQARTPVS
jgi:transcriptional regulator with PAS, ATPase and Fis domain